MRLWTNWIDVFDLAYTKTGNGRVITISEYRTYPIELIPAKILPFTKYRGDSRTFNPDELRPEDQKLYDKFTNDTSYRETIISRNISIYAFKNIYSTQKISDSPLAMPIKDYFDTMINNYERLENSNNLNRSKNLTNKITSHIKNFQYSKDYKLSEIVEFALIER